MIYLSENSFVASQERVTTGVMLLVSILILMPDPETSQSFSVEVSFTLRGFFPSGAARRTVTISWVNAGSVFSSMQGKSPVSGVTSSLVDVIVVVPLECTLPCRLACGRSIRKV